MPQGFFSLQTSGAGNPARSRISARPPEEALIEQGVTLGFHGGIVPQSATAATARAAFVRMPLFQHGSRKAVEHRIHEFAKLGGRAQKGEQMARKSDEQSF